LILQILEKEISYKKSYFGPLKKFGGVNFIRNCSAFIKIKAISFSPHLEVAERFADFPFSIVFLHREESYNKALKNSEGEYLA
jgi:hypothetical protein